MLTELRQRSFSKPTPAMTKRPAHIENILAIHRERFAKWNATPLHRRITENFERIDAHVIPFEKLQSHPMGKGTASQFTVIFMHVPKTGGTTLEYLLAKNYRINGVVHINAPGLQANPYALLRKSDLTLPHVIMGHHKMCQLLYRFVDRPLVHLTMLRDPIRRILSYYNYIQTSPDHSLHTTTTERSLQEFVESEDMVELSNAQTLRFSGLLQKNRPWQKTHILEEAYKCARYSLEHRFSLLGLTERYTEFLLMARKTLNWLDIVFERRNASKTKTHPEDVPGKVMDIIRDRNKYDLALYEFACNLFNKRCAAVGIDAAMVGRFHDCNRHFQEMIRSTDL